MDSLLRTLHKVSMDLSDESYSNTGYEPNAYNFKETSVETYTELLDSPPLFSDKASSADADYDDATLKDMLHQVHRAQVCHSSREDLSVSLSSSSMSDRTANLLEIDRGDLLTLLDDQTEQILAECQARVSHHELQAAQARNGRGRKLHRSRTRFHHGEEFT